MYKKEMDRIDINEQMLMYKAAVEIHMDPYGNLQQ